MINRNIYTVTVIIIGLLFSVVTAAQDKITVRATVDRSLILIGEPIQLKLEADIPQNQPIRFFQVDSIPHFEFLQQDKIDTTNTSEGTSLSQLIHITSFDSGHWVIPSLVLGNTIVTDSIGVDVRFAPFDTSKPYNDIKDIIEVNPQEEKKKQDWRWWIAGGITLLIVIALIILLRKKKKPVILVVAPPPDAYKKAMASLESLRNEKPETKQYYSRLIDIFRIYVSDKKGIHSLQKTTDSLVLQLRDLDLPKDQFEKLSQSLRLSDFVKFAKYIPTGEDDRSIFDTIKKAIDHIEQMP